MSHLFFFNQQCGALFCRINANTFFCGLFHFFLWWKVSTTMKYGKGWQEATLLLFSSINPFCFQYSRLSKSSFSTVILKSCWFVVNEKENKGTQEKRKVEKKTTNHERRREVVIKMRVEKQQLSFQYLNLKFLLFLNVAFIENMRKNSNFPWKI